MLSSGEALHIPNELRLLDRKKRKAQRAVSRRKRGSVRRAKALRRVARIAGRAGRIRRDWQHRVTIDLARRFGTVVLEELKIKNMTRSAAGSVDAPGKNVRSKAGLNRAILEQGWHSFETLLTYKLEERGGHLCKVDPRYTSQTCSSCGAVDRESRKSQAAYDCTTCGHRAHADHNAAINILRRNTASMLVEEGHWPSYEARTGGGLMASENPPALAGGRC